MAADAFVEVQDLPDLRALLVWVGQNADALSLEYGNVASSSVGAIQRALDGCPGLARCAEQGVGADANVVDGWAGVLPPDGWTDENTQNLRSLIELRETDRKARAPDSG